MAGNENCKKQGHMMHICALKAQQFDKKNPDEFQKITQNPEYKCDTCGASANKSENLCEPVKI